MQQTLASGCMALILLLGRIGWDSLERLWIWTPILGLALGAAVSAFWMFKEFYRPSRRAPYWLVKEGWHPEKASR